MRYCAASPIGRNGPARETKGACGRAEKKQRPGVKLNWAQVQFLHHFEQDRSLLLRAGLPHHFPPLNRVVRPWRWRSMAVPQQLRGREHVPLLMGVEHRPSTRSFLRQPRPRLPPSNARFSHGRAFRSPANRPVTTAAITTATRFRTGAVLPAKRRRQRPNRFRREGRVPFPGGHPAAIFATPRPCSRIVCGSTATALRPGSMISVERLRGPSARPGCSRPRPAGPLGDHPGGRRPSAIRADAAALPGCRGEPLGPPSRTSARPPRHHSQVVATGGRARWAGRFGRPGRGLDRRRWPAHHRRRIIPGGRHRRRRVGRPRPLAPHLTVDLRRATHVRGHLHLGMAVGLPRRLRHVPQGVLRAVPVGHLREPAGTRRRVVPFSRRETADTQAVRAVGPLADERHGAGRRDEAVGTMITDGRASTAGRARVSVGGQHLPSKDRVGRPTITHRMPARQFAGPTAAPTATLSGNLSHHPTLYPQNRHA